MCSCHKHTKRFMWRCTDGRCAAKSQHLTSVNKNFERSGISPDGMPSGDLPHRMPDRTSVNTLSQKYTKRFVRRRMRCRTATPHRRNRSSVNRTLAVTLETTVSLSYYVSVYCSHVIYVYSAYVLQVKMAKLNITKF